ncbi:MAG: hypothetical protein IJS28_11605 [Synergistaceae bacterium]|nr:hypothetical protein [Synergistaceae bacterium]
MVAEHASRHGDESSSEGCKSNRSEHVGVRERDYVFSVMREKIITAHGWSRSTPQGTATRLVPKAAKAVGVSMSEFVSVVMSSASCGKM